MFYRRRTLASLQAKYEVKGVSRRSRAAQSREVRKEACAAAARVSRLRRRQAAFSLQPRADARPPHCSSVYERRAIRPRRRARPAASVRVSLRGDAAAGQSRKRCLRVCATAERARI